MTTPAPAKLFDIAILTPHDWRAAVLLAKKQSLRWFRRIEVAMADKNRKKAEYLQTRYLRSLCAKVVAVDTVKKDFQVTTLPNLVRLAQTIDVFRPCDECVKVFAKTKSNGGIRWIFNFGIENAVRQVLVRNAMMPFAPALLDRRQRTIKFSECPAGTKAAVQELDCAFRDGARYGCQLDITSCFPSIGGRILHRRRDVQSVVALEGDFNEQTGLPLPRDVIEHVVRAEHLNIDIRPGRDRYKPYGTFLGPVTATEDARRGIPQGSRCSSIVAEFVIADVLRRLPDIRGARLVMYADNIFAAAETRQGVNLISQILKLAFPGSSTVLLTLHENDGIRRICDGFQALGYVIRSIRGRILTWPSGKNTRKLKLIVRKFVSGWRRTNAACPQEFAKAIWKWYKSFPGSTEGLLRANIFRWIRDWVFSQFGLRDCLMRSPKAQLVLKTIDAARQLYMHRLDRRKVPQRP